MAAPYADAGPRDPQVADRAAGAPRIAEPDKRGLIDADRPVEPPGPDIGVGDRDSL